MFCVGTNILAHFSGSGGSPIILSVPVKAMSARRKIKFVHQGQYVAEVVGSEEGWSPTLDLEDTYKLDDVREALKAGNLKAAA